MLKKIGKIYHRILVFLHLSPLSLAEKCRIAFGAAVLLILALALLIPYAWMRQLTQQNRLDASRARAETLVRRHFQTPIQSDTTLAALDDRGNVMDPNKTDIRWVRFKKDDKKRKRAKNDSHFLPFFATLKCIKKDALKKY